MQKLAQIFCGTVVMTSRFVLVARFGLTWHNFVSIPVLALSHVCCKIWWLKTESCPDLTFRQTSRLFQTQFPGKENSGKKGKIWMRSISTIYTEFCNSQLQHSSWVPQRPKRPTQCSWTRKPSAPECCKSNIWKTLSQQKTIDSSMHRFIHSFIHSIPFHSIPFHSIPFHSIPFHSIPFHSFFLSFFLSFVRSFIHSFIHSFFLSFFLSFVRSFIHSFILSFFLSFVRSFIHSFIHSFFLSFFRSFVHSFIHSFFLSFVRSFVHSFIRSFIHSFVHSFIHSFILSFFLSFIHSFFLSFIHSIPFHSIPFHSVLFYSILFYFILFYSILFYSIPFLHSFIPFHPIPFLSIQGKICTSVLNIDERSRCSFEWVACARHW